MPTPGRAGDSARPEGIGRALDPVATSAPRPDRVDEAGRPVAAARPSDPASVSEPIPTGSAGSAAPSPGRDAGDLLVADRPRAEARQARDDRTPPAARPRDDLLAHGTALDPLVGTAHHHPRARPGEPRRLRGAPLYAALDLGTNNCRLLVAEPQRQGFRVVDAFSRIVRLGEGVSSSGRLSDAAQDRAVEALRICRAKLDLREVRRARLVATEACRIADNSADFLGRVEREAGLELEIVSRETEARLAVAGCASLVDWDADGVILFDIGGGSSELVWLDLRRGERNGDLTRHIRAWTSLPVGVVTLSERHGGVIVDRDVFGAMVDHVETLLDTLDVDGALGRALASGRFHMLGTSGTVTTLAGVHLGLKRYDRRRVDGTWLDDADVTRMIERLLGFTYEERVANPCIGSDRADLVLAGCAILEAIRNRWPVRRLRVADRGLREGILTELMAADGVWRR